MGSAAYTHQALQRFVIILNHERFVNILCGVQGVGRRVWGVGRKGTGWRVQGVGCEVKNVA